MLAGPISGRQVIRLVRRNGAQVQFNILTNRFQIRLVESLDASRYGLVAEHEHGDTVFAGNIHRLDGGIKTILNVGGGQHHTRRVAVATVQSDIEI